MDKIITYLIQWLDKLYSKYYPSDKNEIVIEILQDYSNKKQEIWIEDFKETYWIWATKGMYNVLNDFYNTKLSTLIVEWDANEISKLKYINLILIDLKYILNNNND